MQLLNQSAFLQALGWAIANSLWQMAALWLCYQFFAGLSKKASASIKNLVASFLLFAGCSWFIYGFIHKYATLQNELVLVLQGDKLQNPGIWTSLGDTSKGFFATINSLLAKGTTYLPYLSAAYLFVFSFLFLRLLYAWHQSIQIKTKGLLPVQQEWATHFLHLTKQAGITKKVQLWLSDKIDVPATVGFLKPVILLPVAAINQLTIEQTETILLHELGHIKRHDYLINLFVAIAETILFFNPFAVLLTAHLKKERENSCDDFVLQFRNLPETYAQALLAVEKNRVQPQVLLLKATGDGQLLSRVKRILNVPSKPFNYSQRLIAFLSTAAILSALAWIKPVAKNEAANKVAVSYSSIASSVNANKIVLSPSSIEKRPGGDMLLFDEHKKNSLLVKVEKNKVKLIDEKNNKEILADQLELDKIQKITREAIQPFQDADLLAVVPPPAPAPVVHFKTIPPGESFKIMVAPEMTDAKVERLVRINFKRRVQSEEMKKAYEAIKDLTRTKEWENLPSKEDWDKMQQDMNTELSKMKLQIELNKIDIAQLDSAITLATKVFNEQQVNYNDTREQQRIQLKSLLALKDMLNLETFKRINITPGAGLNIIPGNVFQPVDTEETEEVKEDCENNITKQNLRTKSPHLYRIMSIKKTGKRPGVIISL